MRRKPKLDTEIVLYSDFIHPSTFAVGELADIIEHTIGKLYLLEICFWFQNVNSLHRRDSKQPTGKQHTYNQSEEDTSHRGGKGEKGKIGRGKSKLNKHFSFSFF